MASLPQQALSFIRNVIGSEAKVRAEATGPRRAAPLGGRSTTAFPSLFPAMSPSGLQSM